MNRPNRSTVSQKRGPSVSRRQSGDNALRLQKIILTLVGLLLIAWIIVAGVFVFSARNSLPLQSPVQRTQNEGQALGVVTVTPMPEVTPANPLPAACSQTARVISQGRTRINENGEIEIDLAEHSFPLQLAGLQLSTQDSTRESLVEFTRELVNGQPAILVQEISGPDGAGNLAGYLFVGDTFINVELIRQGLATVDLESPQQACAGFFQQAELTARQAKVGMWQPIRVPTSTFVPFVTLDPAQQPNCDCSQPYECSDFSTHAEAQACYNACNDYDSKLDPDRDGIACEELP